MIAPDHVLARVRQSLFAYTKASDRFSREAVMLDLADALDQRFNEIEKLLTPPPPPYTDHSDQGASGR